MARTRKLHPADAANAESIAAAVRFELALFLGVGRYATETAQTLDEARKKAARLMSLHPNGRQPLIYGVTAEGRSGLVTDALLNRTEDLMKTYAKKFNAQRAAKAAGHNLDDIEIVKANGGYTFRVKHEAKGVHIDDLAKSDHPVAKANSESWDAIPAVKRAGKRGTKQKGKDKNERWLGKRAAIEAAAREGKMPEPPDFSADTHKRFRNKLAAVVELAKARDLKGLRAFDINPVSSSPKAIARYRDLCIMALEARGAEG